MRPLVKILVWLTMAAALALGILYVDVQRAVTKASRVTIQDEKLAAEILARFAYEPAYLSRVVDEIPNTERQMLLDAFPRHTQLVFVHKFARLEPRQKASLVASYVPLLNRSGRLVTGLDRGAKDWLNIGLEAATPQQLDQLGQRRKPSRAKAVRPAPVSPQPPAPGSGNG